MVHPYGRGVLRSLSPQRLGVGLCLVSGLAFAVQPVLGQVALDHGAALTSLLGWRYAIAAVVLALIARRRLLGVPPRIALLAFGMGLIVYSADSALFYAALDRTSAPFASLLHYAHLALVLGVAALVGRERLGPRRLAALVAILSGVVLVSGGAGQLDAVGIALALGSAAAYGVYILASDRLLDGVDPIAFSALLTTGAATAFLATGTARGTLPEIGGVTGGGIAVSAALVGSVFAVTAFLAGIRLVGPATASLLVTIEVPAGLTLAAVVLGERLAPAQLLGAALVVAAIVLLQLRLRLPRLVARPPGATVHVLPVSAVGAEPADALAA